MKRSWRWLCVVRIAPPGITTDSMRSGFAMTPEERTTWATAREEHWSEGLNRASLDVVESAMFVVTLDDSSPVQWNDRAHSLLHGDSTNR